MTDPPPESATSWRLGRLEDGLKEMRGELKEAAGSFNGRMDSLQAQLSLYQATLLKEYERKEESDTVHEDLRRRIDSLADAYAGQGWRMAGALVAASVAALSAVVGWLRPLH